MMAIGKTRSVIGGTVLFALYPMEEDQGDGRSYES